jgi:hypothetical protein
MNFIDILSWTGNVFICLGLWYIGTKKWWAFLFSIIGEAVWFVYAIEIRMWSLAFITAVFAGLAVRNLYLWRKNGRFV